MKNIVVISKGGEVETRPTKKVTLDTLYKKCKLRTNKAFQKQHTWAYNNKFISVYGKDEGRAGMENKYDFPPPLDNKLFFGALCLVSHINEEPVDDELMDLEKKEWEACYNKLFGGFEDLGEDDTASDEVEEIPEEFQTKQGYSKEDGFIVDDDAPVFVEDDDEEEEEYVNDDNSDTDYSADEEEDEDAVYGHDSTDGGDTEEEDVSEDEEDEGKEEDEDPDSELDEEQYTYT